MTDFVVEVGRLRRRLLNGQQLTGIDRVTCEYLGWSLARGGRACIKLGRELRELRHDHAENLLEQALTQWAPDRPVCRQSSFRQRLADLALRIRGARIRDALVINTSQSWMQETGVWRTADASGVRIVSFVHDLIPITHPQYNREHAKPLHEARLRMALRRAVGLVTNSRHTRAALETWAEGEGENLPPTVVLPLGVSLPVGSHTPPSIANPYFVVLGTIEPRKNHLLLLRVWQRLVEKGCMPMPRLVMVGKTGWHAEPVLKFIERCAVIGPYIEVRAEVSDQEVHGLLEHATALLFPSFAEGYGLPLIEALACGTPVIASPLPAFHEIAGDIPDYADPEDDEQWEMLVRSYLDGGEGHLQSARSRLAGFQPPGWKEHFAKLEAFLDSLV